MPAARWLLLPFAVMLFGALTEPMLPGIYMDGVNPDYLVARLFAPDRTNVPHWLIPGNLILDRFPLLANIYYGTLPFWLGLPLYALFGLDVIGIRLTHAVFACLVIASACWMLREMSVRASLAAVVLAAMAIDPAFHFVFRSQFYMLAVPAIFLFASIALLWRPLSGQAPIAPGRLVLSGIAAGIAAFGYFIFMFYAAAVAAVVLLSRDRRLVAPWLLGAVLGFAPMVAGLVGFVTASGSPAALWQLSGQLQPFEPNASLLHNLATLRSFLSLAYSGQGLALMILGEPLQLHLSAVKLAVLLAAPATIAAILEIVRRPDRELRFLVFLGAAPPMAYGLVFGGRLWVHHFTPLVPLLYCTAAVAYESLARARRSGWLRSGVPVLFAAMLVINGNNFQEFVAALRTTGGTGFFSDAVNRLSWRARSDNAVYFVPDWGLLFPLAMITRGHVPLIASFAPEAIHSALCGGRDVVVATIGKDAERLAAERATQVDWPTAASEIWRQVNGIPVIYTTRWQAAGSQERCRR